jgi:hypothetical protein
MYTLLQFRKEPKYGLVSPILNTGDIISKFLLVSNLWTYCSIDNFSNNGNGKATYKQRYLYLDTSRIELRQLLTNESEQLLMIKDKDPYIALIAKEALFNQNPMVLE